MKGFYGIGLLFMLSLFSCNNTEVKEHAEISDNSTAIEMEIKGMVCQMGCVSSIKKELKGLDGVGNFVIDYDNGTAKIEFLSNKITKDEVVRSIESLNDGMYKVQNVKEVCVADCGETGKEDQEINVSESEVSPQVNTEGFELPNFFNLINELLP